MFKKIIATFVFSSIVLSTSAIYAATPLVWTSVEVRETKEKINEKPKEINNSNDSLLTLLATLNQQSQQQLTMLMASLQQSKSSSNDIALKAMQQQQEQFIHVLTKMQDQQQQNTIKLLALIMQNKQDPPPLLKPLRLDELAIPETPLKSEPTLLSITDQAPEPFVPYERKRLAPPDDIEQGILSPQGHIAEAIQDAALEGYYQNSMAAFDYAETALYKIYCKEGYLTLIKLQPGETLQSINGGDSERWTVDVTKSGAQEQILLKPKRSGIDTNFIIVTDKHTYQLQAHSTSWYNPIVSWGYPQETKNRMFLNEKKQRDEKNERELLAVQNPSQLNFNYKIQTRGNGSDWQPRAVFDDGKKVYIQMSEAMKNTEAPALVLKDRKNTIIVNYRINNGYYIIDRLFKEAELRLGSKNYVRIKRTNDLPSEE